jgi:alanine racemase
MILLDHFLRATGGQTVGPTFARAFADFCYDSRLLNAGELFLAVKTEKGDGHDYIEAAARLGAAGVVCERPVDLAGSGVTVIQVQDTRQALLDYAAWVLRHYGTEVVGITGSVGKTSTKEAIAAVLGARFPVFRNYANYNGRYGLPIALGRLEPGRRVAALEMACDAFDEIRLLAELTRPQVGVVTAVNEAHLAYLGSLANIAQEKSQLIRALPAGGVAILNADDPWVAPMAEVSKARVLDFGVDAAAEVRADEIAGNAEGTSLTVRARGGPAQRGRLRLLGAHSAYVALAAVAAGLVYGIPVAEALAALEQMEPLAGRLRPLAGRGGAIILDDTYNSSPAAALVALQTLNQAARPGSRRIAILGVMSDLGSYTEEGQRQVGVAAARRADYLLVKGEEARPMAEAALAAGAGGASPHVTIANTDDDVLRHVEPLLEPGAVILVKGSQEARLEGVVAGLLADPAQAATHLVRQNRAWQGIRLVRPGRPTWVEVDLEAIAGNVERIAAIIGPDVRLMAVLKADGYGHGAIRVARTAVQHGASYLGVACVSEASALRAAGISAPILVLGYTPAWQARELILAGAAGAVFTTDVARAFSRAAQELNRTVTVHVKVDTGMGRLGLLPGEALDFVREIRDLPGLCLEGIFTHFSVADAADKGYTLAQLATFRQVLEQIAADGIVIPLAHAANSAATLTLPASHLNMARVGIALYGLAPSEETPLPAGFRPALTFKTQIAQVKRLPPGSPVSYGNTYRTTGEQEIAVIPVGYADGFRRAPAHWGDVLVKGRRAPIVGRVCMDQTMIDVTHIPNVRQGDEVILIGRQGKEEISVAQVAQQLGTISYEVVSEILARVPRIA